MNPAVKNVLAVIAGIAIGSIVNMGIITIGAKIIPPPVGMDSTDPASIAKSMHLMKPVNFMTPLLAHALGTLVGAYIATRLSTSKHMGFGLGIGAWFLIGGVAAVAMIGGPTWFKATDLLLYLPMGYLGWKLASKSEAKVVTLD